MAVYVNNIRVNDRAWAEQAAAEEQYPGADWGKLMRDAIPNTYERDKAEGTWKEVNIPILIDGVAHENERGPCKGNHYVLGHQVEIEKFRFCWTTWTLENQEIKMNASYDFQVEGPNLLLIDGEVNIFINTIDEPYGNLAYELLTELGKTRKLFK